MAALREARASGKRNYQLKAQDDVYDEVDEDVYRSVVRGRLMEDDFIEEDNGVSGYADNGMDEWDRSASEHGDDDNDDEKDRKKEERKAAKEKKEKQLKAAAKKRAKERVEIAEGANPYLNPSRQSKGLPLQEHEDDFMASLLGDLEGKAEIKKTESPRPAPVPTRRTKPSLVKSAVTGSKRFADIDASSFRSNNNFASSSDFASDPLSSDPGLTTTAPSSDGFDGIAKKARFDAAVDALDNDLGGMDPPMFDSDFAPHVAPLGESNRTNEDVKMEDDEDDLFVKPSSVVKPKGPAQRRQLVNAGAIRPQAPKPEPKDEVLPAFEDQKPKRKGLDWRTATTGLLSANASLLNNTDATDDAAAFNEDHKNVISTTSMRAPAQQAKALEADGSLRFWWFDYDEPSPGVVRLVGKVRVQGETVRVASSVNKAKVEKDVPKYVSATVTVKNIKRKLYVLPKSKTEYYGGDVDDEDSDDEGDELPFDDVEGDFLDDAKGKWNLQNVSCTPGYVKRQYAFGVKGVPRKETNWLEATCDFPIGKRNEVDIPVDAAGEQYSHVFGSTATAFERLVVDHKIMGPCWLNLKSPKINKGDAYSWTKLEAEIDEKDVSPFAPTDANAPKDIPRLTILSLSSRTVVHLKDNKREIVCAAARVWEHVDIDDPTPIEHQGSSAKVFVRNLFTEFPAGFEQMARQQNSGATVGLFKAERPLLVQLLDYITRHDPDVIVGYDFSQLDLDVLLNRLRDLKVDNWSRVGRFRVKGDKWPMLRSGRNTGLLAGRLLVDLTSDGSKSLIDSTTWSLTEMSETHLDIAREDIDPEDTPKYFDNVHSSSKHLMHFVMLCLADCFLQMALTAKVQALPLTRQLTNLAGNCWNRTLAGNRAERNEYILLHRFHEMGYIVPDKISSWEKKAQIVKADKSKKKKARADQNEDEPKVEVKREKFKGGLVFEPEKGLWDRYILVMDYNSLYPSIIQEFDIDFSTIDWTADDAEDLDKMPDRAPCEGEPQGILPQLIASLVARRRIVKGLMKDKTASIAKLKQYDITQMALKLTANSMYGCLGYEGSRFYARPLAALTTFKGREILTRTKADAEAMSLNVIYGDTDSVMINTNQTDYAAALRIGEEFKKVINEKYKKLEIDRDAVFERMLLLNKKKYAARKVEDDGSGRPGDITTEIKGLDMKRREFSKLSKDASKDVLDMILSAKATETVVEEIHEYLFDLGEKIRGGHKHLDDYIIHKRLGKNPEDYPDAKSLPHVQVALKMKAKGLSAKSGDVIPYIFCVPPNGETTKTAQAANAHHPDDVRRQGSTLKIDFEVYLSTQVLPPIERLCEHIEGTEKARLAECLGLDALRFKSSSLDVPEREFKTLQSQISDAQRFADAESFRIRCRACGAEAAFDGGIGENKAGLLTEHGFFCSNIECQAPLSTASLATQLDIQLRAFVTKFYQAWMVCDETTCGNRTRMMSVYGKRCLVAGCRGAMHFEYSDAKLYDQLLYFDSLFDAEKALAKVAGTGQHEVVRNRVEANKPVLDQLRKVITKHLEKNGRRWVSMESLFSFMQVRA
ncbi:DNA-directed DNA polymerase alpha catalytic subunit POL1 [Rhodotorula paludigena]|uniref:DNA-directed DNA polymerase alpha catalytic subunit POL1 n=1 Tax=Rhodotorula paludigena TaxID=86838 RepID=UPI00317FC425